MTIAEKLTGFHAHVYAHEGQSGSDLEAIHRRAGDELAHVRVGRLHNAPIGPHIAPMFQLAFDVETLTSVVAWLLEVRESRSVLIHPLLGEGEALAEHTEHALWIGDRLPVNTEIFTKRQGGADK